MTTILHKRGTGQPNPDELKVGEIAIDTLTGTLYTKQSDGSVVEIGSGSDGAGMVISPDEPSDPITGMQWLESTTGRVWIFDDGKWLEFPANVAIPAVKWDDIDDKPDLDNFQYWQYKVDGFSTTNVGSTQYIDFQAGDNVSIEKEGYGIKISAEGGGGSGLIEVSEEPPEPPYEIGQQWFSSSDGYLYVWYGAEWVATNMKSSSEGGGDSGGDSNWDKVELLINGEDGLVDSASRHTVTVHGNVSIETDVVKYGEGSINLTETGGYLSVTSIPQLNVPFTVETWVYNGINVNGTAMIVAHWRNADNGWTLARLAGGQLNASISHSGSGADGSMNSTGTMSPDQWHHVALSWDGNTYRIFLDGVMESEYQSTNPPYRPPTADLTVGGRITSSSFGQPLYGYIDDLRITRGVCRYTEDFEPPAEHPVGLQRTVYLPAAPMEAQEDGNDADLS